MENLSAGRYAIIKSAATLENEGGKFFGNDFALRYFHDAGQEDLAQCKAIGLCESADLGEYDEFVISNETGYLFSIGSSDAHCKD